RRHAETGCARLLDRVDGDVPQARVVADVVVDLLHPVQVDDEGQARVGLEDLQELDETKRIRAEVDVLLQLEHPCDDVLDPLVDKWLPSADRDDWSRALDAGIDALVD